MIEFQSMKPTKISDGMLSISGIFSGNRGLAIGVDPGVNFGLTLIQDEAVQVVWGKLPTDKRPGWRGIHALNYIENHIFLGSESGVAVVEGAAYYKPFGQVGLEEVRFGFFLALYRLGFDVRIVPPATIRLKAFGSGKKQAGDIWPSLNQNAADSIGCALAALEMKDGS